MLMMRVNLTDDNENWRKWGALVVDWIKNPGNRPANTDAINQQMTDKGIAGNVPGENRPVAFVDYDDQGVFYIALPSKAMLKSKLPTIQPGPYPLPAFYTVAFGGATEASLSTGECDAFAYRRIGEYVINFCC
jgi:hypothetical protein